MPEGIASHVVTEWLGQHAIEPLLLRISELVDADGHTDVAGLRLIAVGPEQAVPPGQVEAEVAVGFAGFDRVVDPVHLRGHHDPAQDSVEPRRQRDVTVIEHRGRDSRISIG